MRIAGKPPIAARRGAVLLSGKSGEKGSVLVMVLWILALIAMLAGEYMAHNRGKASLAVNAVSRFEKNNDVRSALALLRKVSFTPGGDLGGPGEWIELSPGGNRIFVKVEKGENAVNLNSAADNIIRDKIRNMLGEEASMEADRVADAILDWRDDNDLVRANGAEADYYEGEGLGYTPSNGPFKALSELLMVKGVSRELFWGDPAKYLPDRSDQEESGEEEASEGEGEEETDEQDSLSSAFSVHTENVKRVRIIAMNDDDSYEYLLISLEKEGKTWQPLTLHRTTIVAGSTEEE